MDETTYYVDYEDKVIRELGTKRVIWMLRSNYSREALDIVTEALRILIKTQDESERTLEESITRLLTNAGWGHPYRAFKETEEVEPYVVLVQGKRRVRIKR